MDYYHWKLDQPGNVQGIVRAYAPTEAKQKVLIYLNEPDMPLDAVLIEWICPENVDVFEIDEM